MVVILQAYKTLLNVIGSYEPGRNNLKWQLMAICFLVKIMFVILAPLNSQNLEQLASSVITAAACPMLLTIFIHISINRGRFDLLENELQEIVDESEYSTL